MIQPVRNNEAAIIGTMEKEARTVLIACFPKVKTSFNYLIPDFNFIISCIDDKIETGRRKDVTRSLKIGF